MVSTPVSRRPATTSPTIGLSPKAKRAPKVDDPDRPVQPEVPAQIMNNDQLTTAFMQLNHRFEQLTRVVGQIGEAIDDHANRADTAWGMIVKADHTTN